MDVLTDIATIVGALATVSVALMVYFWTRRVERNIQVRQTNNEWQTHNYEVLNDTKRLAIEAENHPFGDVSVSEMRKIYHYFTILNVAATSVQSHNDGLVSEEFVLPLLTNQARITFNDRAFILKHVLSRGYSDLFCRCMIKLWDEIERKQ